MNEQLLTEFIHNAYEGVYTKKRIDIALSIAFNNKKFNINNIEDIVLLKEFVVYTASDHDLRNIKFKYFNQIQEIFRKQIKSK